MTTIIPISPEIPDPQVFTLPGFTFSLASYCGILLSRVQHWFCKHMERQLLIRWAWFTSVVFTVLSPSKGKADEAPLAAAKRLVAEAFSYPETKLRAKLTTDEARTRHGSNVSIAVQFTSIDNTFYPTSIGVGRRGSLFTPEFEAQITEAIAKADRVGVNKLGVRKIVFANEGYAFVGLGASGPGGGESLTYVVLPSKNLDIAIKVAVPGDEPVNIEASPSEYRALMGEGNPEMEIRIVRLAEQVADLRDPQNAVDLLETATPLKLPSKVELPVYEKAPSTVPTQIQSEAPISYAPWIISILILLTMIFLWVKIKIRK